jgi:uncharacterized membrane protein YphA (DoxX/SURF4 family)
MRNLALYGLQLVLGVIVIAAGLAKLAGAVWLTEPLEIIGVGHGSLLVLGIIELGAGLCLLLPRAGVAGAVLLNVGMIAIAAAAIGRSAVVRIDVPQLAAECSYHRAAQHRCAVNFERTPAREWSI